MSAIPPFPSDASEDGSTAPSPTQINQFPQFNDSGRKSSEEAMAALCVPEHSHSVNCPLELFFPSPKKQEQSYQEGMTRNSILPETLRIRQPEASLAASSILGGFMSRSEGSKYAKSRTSGTVFNEECGPDGLFRISKPPAKRYQVINNLLESVKDIWVRSVDEDTFHGPLSAYLSSASQFFQSFEQECQETAVIPLLEWLRVAEWWALKGSTGLKKIPDIYPSAPAQPSHHILEDLLQRACDLKKAQWICYRVFPSHPEATELRILDLDTIDTVDLATLELYSNIVQRYRSIKVITGTLENNMARIQRDTPDQVSSAELDLRIFLPYPSLLPEHETLLNDSSGNSSISWSTNLGLEGLPSIVTSDTALAFHYYNSFLETRLWPSESPVPSPSFACILSIVRDRDSSQSKWILASQTRLFHVIIHSHGKDVVTWKDVRWDVDQKCMWICLAEGFQISAEFDQESEFRRHWSAASQASEFVSRICPRVHERLLFDKDVKLAHHRNYSTPSEFPTSPVEQCAVRLFEQKLVNVTSKQIMEEAAFRMVLATPNSSKYRSCISFFLGQESPVLYNTFDSVDGFPSIMVDTSNNTQTCTVSISFQTPEDRDYFQSCLIGLSSHDPDNQKMGFDVQSLSVSELKRLGGEAASLSKLEFGRASTIVIGPLLNHSLNHDQEKEPELLRIVNLIERGSFVDRIIGDLESLKIGLDVMKTNSIQLYRTEQPRPLTTISSLDQASQEARDAMKELGKLMSKGFSVQLIDFSSKKDLHTFIERIFGYGVIFDGLVNDFIFTRPRTKIPLATKRWCAGLTRVQVLRRNRSYQLLVTFNNFRRGRCMSFVVKSTDEILFYEDKDGYGVRIIDAKYPMPDEDITGISLGSPQYPAEHGDLSIIFTEKSVRDTFATYLPAFAREYYI